MGLPLLQCALCQCVLLGCVLLRLLCELLPTILSMLGSVLLAGLLILGLISSAPVGSFLVVVHALWQGLTAELVGGGTSGDLSQDFVFFFLLRLVPASASHHVTGGASHIIADLLRACGLLFQSLAMFEVIGHLLPQHGHLVQALPAAIRHVVVATDYVVHAHLVIATSVQAEGAEG